MVLTPSRMPGLGSLAPELDLPDVVSGTRINLGKAARGRGLLLMFICRHCPYVKHVERQLAQLGRDYGASPLGIVAISANDAERHPDDAPESLRQMAQELGFGFPYLYDETQRVAKACGAACTPDFFLYDGGLRLVYRGQLDDSRPGNGKPVTGKDLRAAMDALLAGMPVPSEQRASVGCNIKWKLGNEA
jgi:thiol-disulfide isomerase/thioredoxin